MDIRKLQKLAVDALEDVKAKDIEVINTTKLTSLFDRIIVASGDSTRQVKALARSVHDKVKEAGGEVIGIEGEDAGEWVLVDLGDIVVHVMQPAVRAYYNLEELWQTKPKRKTPSIVSPAGEADQSPPSTGRGKGGRLPKAAHGGNEE
jgi:ribosome-associated protein